VERWSAQIPELKRRLAQPCFGLTALSAVLWSDRRWTRFSVEVDDAHVGEAAFAIISNSTPYAFLGPRPFTVTQHADLDRPLALTTFGHMPRHRWILVAAQALTEGIHSPYATQRCDAHRIQVTTIDARAAWHLDGDYMGRIDRLEISYEPNSLSIVAPI
jgi:hypothetical protein